MADTPNNLFTYLKDYVDHGFANIDRRITGLSARHERDIDKLEAKDFLSRDEYARAHEQLRADIGAIKDDIGSVRARVVGLVAAASLVASALTAVATTIIIEFLHRK